LTSTDLHHIVTAALEEHDKRQTAYNALRNNYTSLMCSSYLGNTLMEVQLHHLFSCSKKIMSKSNLSKMRSEIHKLQPEDLEYSIIENPITNSGKWT
jgi:hypothetical protein